MPVWLTTLLIKVVLPIILADLVKSGMMSTASELAVKYGVDFEQFLMSLEFYSKPSDFPSPPPGATNESNVTVGEKQEPKT